MSNLCTYREPRINASIKDLDLDSTRLNGKVEALLSGMTRDEKIGQLVQLDASWGYPPEYLGDRIRAGGVGSVLNTADRAIVAELQRIAMTETRLGIPLLVGRDVIHGFETVMPIPLGQAASWNPALIEEAAAAAAIEASTTGINWTFAPMIDVTRDPRWGRVAESLGEDPFLTEQLGAAMVRGFQGDLVSPTALGACAKHFVGYGAAESGRDYATSILSPLDMKNTHLRPFHAAANAGVASVMTSFSDIDGVPATANGELLQGVLRDAWAFDGLVVSDWDSVRQLQVHGLTDSDRGSAREAINAGVDMEMTGDAYPNHLASLIDNGEVSETRLDDAVRNVLLMKFRLDLFQKAAGRPPEIDSLAASRVEDVSRQLAEQSLVLLKNDTSALPLAMHEISSLAIIGPLAHAPYQQLGTWIFDGDVERSVTPYDTFCQRFGDDVELRYLRALENSRSRDAEQFDKAVEIASASDAVLVFVGEESILSGEAHSRADITLPGAQAELIAALRTAGKPVVAIVLAGRPLVLENILDHVDAVLYAWHPGSQAGPAIVDILTGVTSPSGKLPITFPKMVGQVPIYYNQKNTGKPPTDDSIAHIDDLDTRAPQTSVGMSAYHLDAGFRPAFPFGFGLSYSEFTYEGFAPLSPDIAMGDTVKIQGRLSNTGSVDAWEVAQLYVRDVAASVTRPVRELKAFKRVLLAAGETCDVVFELPTDALGFYGRGGAWVIEPGLFHFWVGGSSDAEHGGQFCVLPTTKTVSRDQ
ncbi:MAG: glycoside hydrolase family 3 N-terminal domain-containing protein [Woeseiaceae bacterium]